MDILKIVLMILLAIDCIALTVIVLMQEGKNNGLGALTGSSDTYWSKNKSHSKEGKIVKWSWIFIAIFFALGILLNFNIL